MQKQVSSFNNNALMLTEPKEALHPSAGGEPSERSKRKAVDELQQAAPAADRPATAQAPDSSKKCRSEDAEAGRRERDRKVSDVGRKAVDKHQNGKDDEARRKRGVDRQSKDSRVREREVRDGRDRHGDSRARDKDNRGGNDRARDKDSRARRDRKGEEKSGSSKMLRDDKARSDSKHASARPRTEEAASHSKPSSRVVPSHEKKDDHRTKSSAKHSSNRAERDSEKPHRTTSKQEDLRKMQKERQVPIADKQSKDSKSEGLKGKHAKQAEAALAPLPEQGEALQHSHRAVAPIGGRESMMEEADASHEKSSHLAASDMEEPKNEPVPAHQPPQLQPDIEQPLSQKKSGNCSATLSQWGEPLAFQTFPDPTL